MAGVHEGMAQVIAALSYIPKGRSQGVNYEFRGIDAVMNALHQPLADAGLFLAPRVLDDWRLDGIPGSKDRTQFQAVFRIEVDVWHKDGSSVTLGPGLAQSHDYGDKAVYQAQQNALKYLLLESFCIPTAEQDMDGREADASPRAAAAPPSDPHKERIVKHLRDRNIPLTAFGAYLASEGFEMWDEVPDNQKSAMADGVVKGILLDDIKKHLPKDAA